MPMKISRLIEQLQQMQGKRGDINIFTWAPQKTDSDTPKWMYLDAPPASKSERGGSASIAERRAG